MRWRRPRADRVRQLSGRERTPTRKTLDGDGRRRRLRQLPGDLRYHRSTRRGRRRPRATRATRLSRWPSNADQLDCGTDDGSVITLDAQLQRCATRTAGQEDADASDRYSAIACGDLQRDTDGPDGFGNPGFADADRVADACDLCPYVANLTQVGHPTATASATIATTARASSSPRTRPMATATMSAMLATTAPRSPTRTRSTATATASATLATTAPASPTPASSTVTTTGSADACDNCPCSEPGGRIRRRRVGDACDNCPTRPRTPGPGRPDGDGRATHATADTDDDGRTGEVSEIRRDNCPTVANATRRTATATGSATRATIARRSPTRTADADGDGVGDACATVAIVPDSHGGEGGW